MKDNHISQAGEPAGASVQSQPGPPRHILLVEDDIFLRKLNTAVLVRSGYKVDGAADGAAAWQALNTDSYDLMVTDNNMPKVSGVELLRKLRAARMLLPVIMATEALPTEEFTRYPWLKPDVALLKPIGVGELLETVKKVLRETDDTADSAQPFMHRDKEANKISQAAEPARAPRQCPANCPHRILVVDEDSDLRLLYAEVLARPGYCVDVAGDGEAGWEALQANSYNLLIIENDMPHLTGVELVKKLRSACMAVPVVMAAGRLPSHELARNPALHLAATLLKPFDVDALLDTVNKVLREADSLVS